MKKTGAVLFHRSLAQLVKWVGDKTNNLNMNSPKYKIGIMRQYIQFLCLNTSSYKTIQLLCIDAVVISSMLYMQIGQLLWI